MASENDVLTVIQATKTTRGGDGGGLAGGSSVPAKATRPRRSMRGTNTISSEPHILVVGPSQGVVDQIRPVASFFPKVEWQEFIGGQEFIRVANQLGTGCALICDPLGDIEALSVVSWLGQQRADLAAIVLPSRPTVKFAVDFLKAGATDYLSGPIDTASIVAALNAAFQPAAERPNRSSAMARLKMSNRLSQREMQVLEGLLEGKSNRAVGEVLHISERTVEVHRSRIMRQLNVTSFAELVRMSVRAGIGNYKS